MDTEYDLEYRKEYDEFIKEYGWRDECDFDNPEFTPQWDVGETFQILLNHNGILKQLNTGERVYFSGL